MAVVALNLDLLDLHTTGLKVFGTLLVIGDDGAALGIVISVSLETLHLSRLHVVEILLAEMDAADLVTDDVGLDVLLRSCL